MKRLHVTHKKYLVTTREILISATLCTYVQKILMYQPCPHCFQNLLETFHQL